MSFLNDLLKIGGTVAQFVPGGAVAGQVAGALGGLLDASSTSGKKTAAANTLRKKATTTGDNADQLLALQQSLLPGLVHSAVDNYNNFDLSSYIDPKYRAIVEGAGSNADNVVNQVVQDYANRGLGRDSSGLAAATAAARASVGAAGSRAMSDLLTQGLAQKQALLNTALGAVTTAGSTGRALNGDSVGTMGGLEGMYASDAGNMASALGDLATIAGKVAKRPAKSGNATLNTNNAATPVPASLGGPITLNYDRDQVSTAPVKKVRGGV